MMVTYSFVRVIPNSDLPCQRNTDLAGLQWHFQLACTWRPILTAVSDCHPFTLIILWSSFVKIELLPFKTAFRNCSWFRMQRKCLGRCLQAGSLQVLQGLHWFLNQFQIWVIRPDQGLHLLCYLICLFESRGDILYSLGISITSFLMLAKLCFGKFH